jgi:hypothetical protein
MSIVTKLTALLTADSSQFEAGLKKSKKTMADFTSAIKTGAVVAGAGLLAIGASMLSLGKRSAELIDKNYDTAKSLGLLGSEFRTLSIVAEESGATQEEFTTAFTKSQQAIANAAQGSKGAIDNFNQLGLSVDDLLKMSPREQFIAIGEAIAKIENPTLRTGLAMELLGKGGRSAIGMLEDLGLKYNEASQFAEKFNISISDIDAEQVGAVGDSFGRVGMVIEGVGNTIAVQTAPLVEELNNQLVESAISGEDLGYAIKYGMTIAAMAVDVVRKAILGFKVLYQGVFQGIFELAAKAKEVLTGDGGVLREAANLAKEDVRAVIDEINNFETSASKLDEIYAGARQRATERASSGRGAGGGFEGITSGAKDAKDETLKLIAETRTLGDVYEEFEKSSTNAVDTLISDLGRGGNALQSFRNFAVSILQDVLKSLNGGNTLGSSLGSIIAGGLTNIFTGGSALSKGIQAGGSTAGLYGGLASISGSFATGIAKVPYDMNARVHKGEAIIPASQVDNMGSNGSMVVNIDARGAEKGVEEKIRAVMGEVQKLRMDSPKIALNVVAEQSRRNPNFVR